MIISLILIAIGVIALLIKLGVLAGSVWSYTWPIILIILGLSFLGGRRWRHPWLWGYCGRWHHPGEEDEKR